MRRLLAPVLLLLAALALAHPAQAQEPGLSDSEIVLGMWTCLTGPTALLGTSARDGVQVWVNEINEAGGIHGRKLRLVVYDDGGSPQEALAAVRRLVDQDKVFMLMAGSTSGATLPVIPPFGSGRTSIHVVPGCSTMSSPDLVTR